MTQFEPEFDVTKQQAATAVMRRVFAGLIAIGTALAFGAIGWTIGVFLSLTTKLAVLEWIVTFVFGAVGALVGARAISSSRR